MRWTITHSAKRFSPWAFGDCKTIQTQNTKIPCEMRTTGGRIYDRNSNETVSRAPAAGHIDQGRIICPTSTAALKQEIVGHSEGEGPEDRQGNLEYLEALLRRGRLCSHVIVRELPVIPGFSRHSIYRRELTTPRRSNRSVAATNAAGRNHQPTRARETRIRPPRSDAAELRRAKNRLRRIAWSRNKGWPVDAHCHYNFAPR